MRLRELEGLLKGLRKELGGKPFDLTLKVDDDDAFRIKRLRLR